MVIPPSLGGYNIINKDKPIPPQLINTVNQFVMQQKHMEQQQPYPSSYPVNISNRNQQQFIPSPLLTDNTLITLLSSLNQGILVNTNMNSTNHINTTGLQTRTEFEQRDEMNNNNPLVDHTTHSIVAPVTSNPTTTSSRRQVISRNQRDTKYGGKRSRKPRPPIYVPPIETDAIIEPSIHDVLCGRGGRVNSHPGNVQFRKLVSLRQEEYLSNDTKKLDKAYIAAEIVAQVRNEMKGRFLQQNHTTSTWYEVGDARAIRKVLQALRENAPDIREMIR